MPITGLDQAAAVPETLVFHAGTTARDHSIVTSGGRVITVVGRGIDFATARARAYDAAALIRFDDLHLRHDIGVRAVALEAQLRA
jgi:phosphoribosylamine--glycine ligase